MAGIFFSSEKVEVTSDVKNMEMQAIHTLSPSQYFFTHICVSSVFYLHNSVHFLLQLHTEFQFKTASFTEVKSR